MEPKVSVIIPVYNTEKYLRQCLDSVINQSLREIEIICVDDGSTDGSTGILLEYAARDERIRVIAQENKGVSCARNTGLALARGSWIGWVDSDDWIEPDMFEYLLQNVLSNKADIAVCSHINEYYKHGIFTGWKQTQIHTAESALRLLLENDCMKNVLWDKLWRKKIFEGISFPEGRTFEDIAVMHKLFLNANTLVCLPDAKYHYRQRNGSIMNDSSLGNRINDYIAAKARYDQMAEDWPQFLPLLEAQCIVSSMSLWCNYLSAQEEERIRYKPQMIEISNFAKEHKKDAIKSINLGMAGKAVVNLLPYRKWWAFALAKIISRLYELRKGRPL